jgi:predicted RNA binding protein YcfA (HicA-like mRNA interferase family)
MKKIIKELSKRPWYPLLLSVYPVLAMFAANLGEARLNVVIRPMAVFLLGTTILFLVFRLLLRDWHRAAFAASTWLILFASYGHLVIYLQDQEINISAKYILILWIILAVLFLWLAFHKKIQFGSAAPVINLVVVLLMVFPLYQVISAKMQNIFYSRSVEKSQPLEIDQKLNADLPDIYYIIMDMYTRSDLMETAYGYDNSEFIKFLEDKGFYVANCSQSNYMRTDVSLASTLNMDYLQNLSDSFKPDTYSRTYLFEILKHSEVRKTLEAAGYQTVAFATGFPWSEFDDADVFMAPSPLKTTITDFEQLLLSTTLARLLDDYGFIDSFQISSRHYSERTKYVFESIPNVVKIPGPKFAFIHIINPHPPFVFGPNGEPTNPADFHNADDKITRKFFAEGYINQVQFVQSQMEQAIDTILKNSKTPPVILLQGDHGPWLQTKNKRFWILNAYYLPGKTIDLYPTISPVNSFRIILDNYLGFQYPLLDDESYFSPIPYIYDFSYYGNPCK